MTVTGNVRRLERAGYLRVANDRALVLTDDGRDLASTLLRNVRLAEEFLRTRLGIGDDTLRVESERWGMVMSDDVADALADYLEESPT